VTPERIVALLIGVAAISFGSMLLPYAGALRRKMLRSREPPPVVELRLTHGMSRTWRNHLVPWMFLSFGVALLLLAVFGA
jgi:hypothetical protein